MSDAAIRRRSGKGWKEWLRILDAWGATEHTHTEIARYVSKELGVDGWSAQAVTVGYERARGMRRANQRPDGYTVSVSKTVAVDVHTLSRAFTEARTRNRWLEPGVLKVRTSQPGRSARFDVDGGRMRAGAWFTSKGSSKASVAIGFERLPDRKAVEETRAIWKERLTRLSDVLTR